MTRHAIEPAPGTYALVMRCLAETKVAVGRWGEIRLESGYYTYVGSAFGPGGVRARVSRHLRQDKRRHWHLDYVRGHLAPISVWYTHDEARREHGWAQSLQSHAAFTGIEGFGCSDCGCIAHFFASEVAPDQESFPVGPSAALENLAVADASDPRSL
jgi:Uri superfamily endonuclease